MKQEEKSMASKGRVLEAAASLFIRKGYEETTMQDIMEESGLSKGAIYHHFAGKQEILSTMIADAQMKVNTFFQEMEENAEMTVKEKISRIIRYFFDNKNQSMLIRNRWVEKVPYALVDTVRNGNAFIAPRVAGIIKQGNENGEFRCDFPEELAEALEISVEELMVMGEEEIYAFYEAFGVNRVTTYAADSNPPGYSNLQSLS